MTHAKPKSEIEQTEEVLELFRRLTPRQQRIFVSAMKEVNEGRASLLDDRFCAKLSAELEEARQ